MTGQHSVGSALRHAGPYDAQLLATLHHRCFARGTPPPWRAEHFLALLSRPATCALLAQDSPARPVGLAMAWTVADEAELLTIGVVPERRRAGFATCLLAAVIAWADRAGACRLFLEVAADNGAAVDLYRAVGMTVVGRRKDYYRGEENCIDALVMQLSMSDIMRPRFS